MADEASLIIPHHGHEYNQLELSRSGRVLNNSGSLGSVQTGPTRNLVPNRSKSTKGKYGRVEVEV